MHEAAGAGSASIEHSWDVIPVATHHSRVVALLVEDVAVRNGVLLETHGVPLGVIGNYPFRRVVGGAATKKLHWGVSRMLEA